MTKPKTDLSNEVRDENLIMDRQAKRASILDNDQTGISSLKSLFNSIVNSLSANSGLKGLDILEGEPQ